MFYSKITYFKKSQALSKIPFSSAKATPKLVTGILDDFIMVSNRSG